MEADEIGFREESVHVAVFSVHGFFRVFGSANRIRVNHLHLETEGAASNGAANTAKADYAEGFAPNISATELIEIPTLPIAGTSQGFTFAEAASDGEEQGPGKIGSRLIENTGSVGGDDNTLGAGVDVYIVEADGDIRHDAELGGGPEKLFVDFFGEQADQAFPVFHATQDLVSRRALWVTPILDVAIGVQDFSGFFEQWMCGIHFRS